MEENKYRYNSYPLGKVPRELQRSEIYQLKDLGYEFNDAREIIDIFEKKVANFAGSKYAISVDCCSHGIFLALKYLQIENIEIIIPNTYVSVPMQVIHSGNKPFYKTDIEWSGVYQLFPTRVWDGAVRWTKGMYLGNNILQIVSFQFKKRIPIGKGGMILTDSEDAYKTLKLMSYDGRDLTLPYDDPNHVKMLGYHMYMTPEDAARGIILMDNTPDVNEDSGNWLSYPNVQKMMKNI